MRLATIFLATGAVCLNLTAQIQVFDSGDWPEIQVAAQIPGGGLTTAGVGDWHQWNWNEYWQPTYNNSPWNRWGSGDTARGNPASMETVGDGMVVSLWDQKDDGSVFCLVHDVGSSGIGNARFAGLHGPAANARVFVDAQTNFWITEAGLNLCTSPVNARNYRQTPKPVHTITTDELWPGGSATNRLPVSIAEDARGRIWFWSNCLFGDDSRGAVRGVLICENEVVTHRPALDGVTDGRISVIAPLNATNLWLAVRDAGIFAVNLETLRGSPVAEPEAGAFQVVQNIFQDGGDIYVIAGAGGDFDDHGCENILWRKRGGAWKKMISGLDSTGTAEQFADRRWLFTDDGLWLGAFGTGGWFVPRNDGKPRQIAWQSGSPLDTIHRWFQLKNGQMLALQFGRGGLIADTALLTAPAAQPTAEVFQLDRPIIQTADGKIFAIRREKLRALSEWDGRRWICHPFPDKVQLWGECRIATDARNRVWFIDQSYNPDPVLRPTLIFDAAAGKFIRLSSFRSALQSQAAKLAGTRLGDAASPAAVFAADGRVSYTDRNYQVCYFDGHEWRSWEYYQIVKNGQWGAGERVPFFGGDGKLAMDFSGKIWQLDELGGWKSTEMPAPKKNGDTAASLPVGTPDVPDADSIVADRRGIYWVVARRQVFRAGFGLRAAAFPANEPQPFADGRKLTAAYADNAGNAFLQTALSGCEEAVFIPARGALPKTKIALRTKSDDAPTLELSAINAATPRFIWRLDDGEWSAATTNTMLQLDDVAAGHHRVQVIAIDERLQTDPAPVEISFESRLDPAQRLQRLIAQLGDKDFARREAAVKSLARQRQAALPVLRAARDHETDPDRRWWLDAAIQQCE